MIIHQQQQKVMGLLGFPAAAAASNTRTAPARLCALQQKRAEIRREDQVQNPRDRHHHISGKLRGSGCRRALDFSREQLLKYVLVRFLEP